MACVIAQEVLNLFLNFIQPSLIQGGRWGHKKRLSFLWYGGSCLSTMQSDM